MELKMNPRPLALYPNFSPLIEAFHHFVIRTFLKVLFLTRQNEIYIKEHGLPSTRCAKVDYQCLQRITKYYRELNKKQYIQGPSRAKD
jgi:hypothetical protein